MKREKTEGAKPVAAKTATKPRTTTRTKAVKPEEASKPVTKTAAPVKKKVTVPAPAPIRHEDIAFRAYLIGEKRQQQGLPGDSMSDWVEAERQLICERATHGVN